MCITFVVPHSGCYILFLFITTKHATSVNDKTDSHFSRINYRSIICWCQWFQIHRKVCAAPRATFCLTKDMAKIVSCCPETPVTGGNHLKSSKFCPQHHHLDPSANPQPTKKKRILVTINIPDQKVSTRVAELADSTTVPDNNDESVHVGCKEARNVPRFFNRTAGVMVIVKPCGIMVSAQEMLSCESPSQLFIQLLRLHCDSPVEVKYLGYDRACEFHPFLRNLSKKGNSGAEQLLSLKYLVDRFHVKGHTTPECDLNSDSCQYHPDHPDFAELLDVNTECAEQCFSWLGKFKHTMKYMSQYKFKFFLYTIINARNHFVEAKLKKKLCRT